jgi:hypothetical protein
VTYDSAIMDGLLCQGFNVHPETMANFDYKSQQLTQPLWPANQTLESANMTEQQFGYVTIRLH